MIEGMCPRAPAFPAIAFRNVRGTRVTWRADCKSPLRAICVCVLAVLSNLLNLLVERGRQDLQLPCLSIVCISIRSVKAGSIFTLSLCGANGCAACCREGVVRIDRCSGTAWRRCLGVVHRSGSSRVAGANT